MGLMDKVKAQATQLAQKTQDTARDSKVKFDQSQAKRQGDVMLRNLGAAVYADRTGRGTADTAAEIDRLVTEITSHEAENEISLTPEPTDHPVADSSGAASAEPSTWYPSSPPEPPAEFSSAPGPPAGFPPAPEPSTGFPPAPEPSTGFPPAPEPAPAAAAEPAPPAEAFPPAAPTGFPPEAG